MHRSGDGDEPLNVKVTRRTPSVGFQVSYSGEHNGSWLDLTVVLQCHREREVRERERDRVQTEIKEEGMDKTKQSRHFCLICLTVQGVSLTLNA